jgi:hypothetical protein
VRLQLQLTTFLPGNTARALRQRAVRRFPTQPSGHLTIAWLKNPW